MLKEFPKLYTERFVLRKIELRDLKDIYGIYSNKEAANYIPLDTYKSFKEVKNEIRRYNAIFNKQTGIQFGIAEKETNRIIGTCGFLDYDFRNKRAELGYNLMRNYWGNGIMTEVATEIIYFGFSVLGLNRIEARIYSKNGASRNLLYKLGFQKEGILREFAWDNGKPVDVEVYSNLRKGFLTYRSNLKKLKMN